MTKTKYKVLVTWGTIPHTPYVVGIGSLEDAEALRRTAVSKGYTDARIELDVPFYKEKETE